LHHIIEKCQNRGYETIEQLIWELESKKQDFSNDPKIVKILEGVSLIAIEFYNFFLCANVNLGLGTMRLFEPGYPKRETGYFDDVFQEHVKAVPYGFSIWDKVLIDRGDLTLKELVDSFPEIHHGCTVRQVMFKSPNKDQQDTTVWTKFTNGSKALEERTRMETLRVSEIFVNQFGDFPTGRNYILIDVVANSADGTNESKVPQIHYVFRK